jgi:hypothetical protein
VIETLGKRQGHGAVICMVDAPLQLSETVTALSVAAL